MHNNHMCTCRHTHKHTYLHTHILTSTLKNVHTHAHAHTHTRARARAHTHSHSNTHTMHTHTTSECHRYTCHYTTHLLGVGISTNPKPLRQPPTEGSAPNVLYYQWRNNTATATYVKPVVMTELLGHKLTTRLVCRKETRTGIHAQTVQTTKLL